MWFKKSKLESKRIKSLERDIKNLRDRIIELEHPVMYPIGHKYKTEEGIEYVVIDTHYNLWHKERIYEVLRLKDGSKWHVDKKLELSSPPPRRTNQ